MNFQLNLKTEPIEDLASKDPPCMPSDASVREVLEHLKDVRTGATLICRNGVLMGIFTERDALRLMAENSDLDRPIDEVMVPEPVTLQSNETVADAISKMADGGYRRLPVVNHRNEPIGILKVSSVLRYFVECFPETIYTLPPEPNQVSQEREGA